jgi:hypothetical protein
MLASWTATCKKPRAGVVYPFRGAGMFWTPRRKNDARKSVNGLSQFNVSTTSGGFDEE